MEILFYILIGIIVGGIAVWLLRNSRIRQLTVEKDTLNAQLSSLNTQFSALNAERAVLQKEVEMIKEQHGDESRLRQEQFAEQLKLAKEQFTSLASAMLNQTTERLNKAHSEHVESLNKANTDSMQQLTKPIKDDFDRLEQMIKDSNEKRTAASASLSERLRQMSEQTEKMDQTAQRLTRALRGDNKQAGDWGEQILSTLLDSQGFTQGIDYDIQQSFTTDDQRLRPDVILHYPDDQDVIIDSKVSIKAYYDYINEPNEQLKKMHLDRLISAVRSQAKDLASKDYSSLNSHSTHQKPINPIDFVIMFVPNEAALQLVLASDPKLWNEAFERKVFITSTQNLFAILRMIQIAWRQHRQTENQQKILNMAEQLLSRIGLFIERADLLEANINTLQKNYGEMRRSLDGRMGIVQKANEMKSLGVKEDAKHRIPNTGTEEE